MAKDFKSDDGSFLGGAGKFNALGNNVPMPGEKTVLTFPLRLHSAGLKIWLSVLLIRRRAGRSYLHVYEGDSLTPTREGMAHIKVSSRESRDSPATQLDPTANKQVRWNLHD